MSRPSSRGPWLLSLLLALAFLSSAAAQATPRPLAQGTTAFLCILSDEGFTPLKGFDQLDDPAGTILIVLGNLDVVGRVPGGLADFIKGGGAALLASDRQTKSVQTLRTIGDIAGVQITGTIFTCPVENPRVRFRNLDFCPLLRPAVDGTPNLFGGTPLVPGSGLNVATNLPSSLRFTGDRVPGVSVLARLPWECEAPGRLANPVLGEVLGVLGAGPLFAVGGEAGDGRFLILADHSIFINEMMLAKDNNNVEFTDNCLSWLRGNGRNKVLFVEDGKPKTSFDVPLKAVSIDTNRLLLQFGQRLVELGKQDAYNQTLLNRISPDRESAVRWLVRGLILVLSLVLAIYLARRIGSRGRFRVDPAQPRLERALQPHTPERALLEQREQALLATGSLAEVARMLSRQCFAAVGYPPPEGGATAAAPRLEVLGHWWARQRWGRRVRRLWQQATATGSVRVSGTFCRRLARDAEELQEAVHRGTVRLSGNPT